MNNDHRSFQTDAQLIFILLVLDYPLFYIESKEHFSARCCVIRLTRGNFLASGAAQPGRGRRIGARDEVH